LFHALRKMGITTIFFINNIDQNGINLSADYQNIMEKLSEDIIIKQNVNLIPNTIVMNFTKSKQWEAVIARSEYLLEKYTLRKPLETLELEQEENRRFQNCSLYPIYHGSAKNNVWIEQLIEVITNKFFSSTYRNQDEL